MLECLHPEAPDEQDLIRHILEKENFSDDINEHLAQCTICQQRLKYYEQFNAALIAQLYRSQCPNSMELSLYCSHAHYLTPEQRSKIEQHLQQCPLCAAEVADSLHFLGEMEALAPSSFPLLDEACSIAAQIESQYADGDTNIEGWSPWPQQHRVANIDLLLDLSLGLPHEYLLSGYIINAVAQEYEGIEAELLAQEATDKPRSTYFDHLGNIAFHKVPEGQYRLLIHLPAQEIAIDGLTVGEKMP